MLAQALFVTGHKDPSAGVAGIAAWLVIGPLVSADENAVVDVAHVLISDIREWV